MDEDDKIALIDLDGSIADYDGVMKRELDKLRDPSEPPVKDRYTDRENNEIRETPHLEARRKLIQAKPGFWRNLPRHPLGFQIVEVMRSLKFKLQILTKGPSSTPGAWSEKFEWCKANIPDASVTVTEDKSGSYGRVLLDDWPPYFIPWLKHRTRGVVIMVAQPWNTDMSLFIEQAKGLGILNPRIVRYDGTNLNEVQEQLQWAYSRPAREG